METLNTYKLTNAERLAVIKFCLNYGTRIKCSTRQLLRPLDMEELEAAFMEKDEERKRQTESYRKLLENYKNGKPLNKFMQQWFEAEKPPVEKVEEYCSTIIKQTNDIDTRRAYNISVGLDFISGETLAFHKSLNPRVTFGYSNVLHEECDAELTRALRKKLLPCFEPDEIKKINENYFSCGAFNYGALKNSADSICYEDLEIRHGERGILSTVSHEGMLSLDFNEDDINAFLKFDKGNEKILKQMRVDI